MVVTLVKTSVVDDATDMLRYALDLEVGRRYYTDMAARYQCGTSTYNFAERQLDWYADKIIANQRQFKERIAFLTAMGFRPYVKDRIVWLNNPEEIA